jgi:hypothetical protein
MVANMKRVPAAVATRAAPIWASMSSREYTG